MVFAESPLNPLNPKNQKRQPGGVGLPFWFLQSEMSGRSSTVVRECENYRSTAATVTNSGPHSPCSVFEARLDISRSIARS